MWGECIVIQKKKRSTKKGGMYGEYNNAMDFIIDIIPNKELKEVAKMCNKKGVIVKGLFPSYELTELEYLTLKITKDNERRIFSIIKELSENTSINILFLFDDSNYDECVRIYGNSFNKVKVFNIVKNACKKKCNESSLPNNLKEIYRLHKLLLSEGVKHEIRYKQGIVVKSIIINNIDSYFDYEANIIKSILKKLIWEKFNDITNSSFVYQSFMNRHFIKKIELLNTQIEEEFKQQEIQFKAYCNKYRRCSNN